MQLKSITGAALLWLACFVASPLYAADDANREFLFGGDFPMKPSDKVRQLFYESGMNCIRLTGGGYSWAPAGQEIALTLTIHNPSSHALAGKVNVRLNGIDSPDQTAVNIAPGGHQAITLKAKPVLAAGRAVLNAALHHENGDTPGIPVDVTQQ